MSDIVKIALTNMGSETDAIENTVVKLTSPSTNTSARFYIRTSPTFISGTDITAYVSIRGVRQGVPFDSATTPMTSIAFNQNPGGTWYLDFDSLPGQLFWKTWTYSPATYTNVLVGDWFEFIWSYAGTPSFPTDLLITDGDNNLLPDENNDLSCLTT